MPKTDKTKLFEQTAAAKNEQARVAASQKTRKRLSRPEDGKTPVAIPGGQLVNLEDFVEPLFHEQDASDFLHSPEKYLKDPKPHGFYAWARLKDAKTKGFLRSKLYRQVTKDELRDDYSAPLETHEGIDDGVYWEELVLVELAEKMLKMKVNQAFSNSSRLASVEEGYKHGVATNPATGETLSLNNRGHAVFEIERTKTPG